MIKRYEVGPRMSQAVACNGTVYVSGQVANNRRGSIEEQTAEVLDKIEALLKQSGSDKSRVLAINVFLAHIVDFDRMNSIYDAWIDKANPPARACTEARLADANLRVEMTAVAAI